MYSQDLLKDKVCLITGGGTGLGRAIALRLAGLGCDIVVGARQKDRLDETVAQVEQTGRKGLAVAMDLRDYTTVKAMTKEAVNRFGRIDFLINGAAANFVKPAEKISAVRWDAVIQVVLNGAFYTSKEIGEVMMKQGGGKILNLVTNYGESGGPGVAPSAAAKAGVINLTKTLALEWAQHNIQVNALAPGPVDTPQTREHLWPTPEIFEALVNTVPARRMATVQEITDQVAFLLSPAADYITGAVLTADGGQTLFKLFYDLLPMFKK
jgi:hypothetical protein